MEDLIRTRFQDAPWLQGLDDHYLTIGGCGGIGTWLVLLLSRIGFPNMDVYDFDVVEKHNMGGQWFKRDDKGSFKVEATKDNVFQFSELDITAYNEKVTEATAVGNIVFSAFDNMEARKALFNAWKKQNESNPDAIFIDGRLAAEQWELFCIRNNPEDIAYYESPEVLFTDEEATPTVCSFKQTSHFAAMLGSFMTSYLTNHLTNIVEKDEVREVPRYTKYIGQLNLFESE